MTLKTFSDRGWLFASVAAVALQGLAGSAHAQATPTAAPAQATTLGEVIVTAQRRSQNLQTVPVAVTAATGVQLATERVTNIENIKTLSPSIVFGSANFAASTGNILIRGIGTTGNSRSFEGAVGVFIDGVYRTRSGQALEDFLDIDSLEILRGPQGTLFGKNTSAGAITLTSVKPSTSGYSGDAEVTYGNYNYYLIKAAVNLPLGDDLALRVSALTSDHQGYLSNPEGAQHYNQSDNTAVKAQLLFKPNDRFTALLIGDYARSSGNCCYGTVAVVNPPGITSLVDAFTAQNGLKVPSTNINQMQSQIVGSTQGVNEDYGGTLKLDYDVGPGRLNSITGVRRFSASQNQNATFDGADILPLTESFKSDFVSQELTYAGKIDGPVKADYLFGGYYSNEILHMGRNLSWGSQAQQYWNFAGLPFADAAPGLFSREVMHATSRSESVFTHWDVSLTDQFNVIAGVRYSHDAKTGSFANPYFRDPVLDPLAVVGVMPGIPYSGRTAEDSVSGTVTLQYHPSRDIMLYASYNRGSKSGGVNLDVNAAGTPGSSLGLGPAQGIPSAITQRPIFQPETNDAFEIGEKIDWLDGRARTNGAVFYNDLTNLQVAQFVGLQFAVLNAPKAHVLGAEIEQLFKVTQEISLNGALTWLPEAKYGVSPLLNYVSGPTSATLSGRRFGGAPDVAATLSASIDHPVSEGLAITGRIQGEFQSKVYTSTATDLTQGQYTLLNLSVGVRSSKGWSAELWAQNLTDVHYVTATFPTPIVTGVYSAYIGAPRTFGISLRGKF